LSQSAANIIDLLILYGLVALTFVSWAYHG